jgi:hypothetical protein
MSESCPIGTDGRCLCRICLLRRSMELARALNRKFAPGGLLPAARLLEPPVLSSARENVCLATPDGN